MQKLKKLKGEYRAALNIPTALLQVTTNTLLEVKKSHLLSLIEALLEKVHSAVKGSASATDLLTAAQDARRELTASKKRLEEILKQPDQIPRSTSSNVSTIQPSSQVQLLPIGKLTKNDLCSQNNLISEKFQVKFHHLRKCHGSSQ